MFNVQVRIIAIIMAGIVAFTIDQTSHATSNSDLIFLKDEDPYGKSFSEWVGKWWQWQVSLPHIANKSDPTNLNLIHPREAYMPSKCAWNQNDTNVWFLPDGRNLSIEESSNPEFRECNVPSGKALLVQIYGGGCSYGEGLKTDTELKDCVNIGLDTVKFNAKIDGVEVINSEEKNKILPSPFLYNLTYIKDNLYEVPEGTYRAMANGYFLFVKPLSNGTHTIEFQETFFKPGFEGQPSIENRISNVVYQLTVG